MSSYSDLYSTSPNHSWSQFPKHSNHFFAELKPLKFVPLMPLVPHGRNVSPTSEFPSNDLF